MKPSRDSKGRVLPYKQAEPPAPVAGDLYCRPTRPRLPPEATHYRSGRPRPDLQIALCGDAYLAQQLKERSKVLGLSLSDIAADLLAAWLDKSSP